MWLSRLRNRKRCSSAALGMAFALWKTGRALSQTRPPVRGALPINEPPVQRALPVDRPPAAVSPRPAPPAPNNSPVATAVPDQSPAIEAELSDRRQLDYATALYGRKLYDLAVPEFEKYLEQYSGAPGEAQAQFFLAESYRALNKPGAARKNFQAVLDHHGDAEYAGA